MAVDQYRAALRAWSTQDLAIATQLVEHRPRLAVFQEQLVNELRRLDGPDAVAGRHALFTAGQAADRIADHAAIIGARLRHHRRGRPPGGGSPVMARRRHTGQGMKVLVTNDDGVACPGCTPWCGR